MSGAAGVVSDETVTAFGIPHFQFFRSAIAFYFPFAFSPASPADIDVRAAFSRSVGTDLDSASYPGDGGGAGRATGGARRRCLIAIIRSCKSHFFTFKPLLG